MTSAFYDSSLPQAPPKVEVRPPPRPKLDDPVERAQRRARLARLAGPLQLRAGAMALLTLQRGERELGVLRQECADLPTLDALLADIDALAPGERQPWLERLLAAVAKSDPAERKQLLRAARRLMAADGHTSVADRLIWLGLRHALGDARALAAPGAAQVELEDLDAQMVGCIGRFSAFLSRLVPAPEVDVEIHAGATSEDAPTPAGLWWRTVMALWPDAGAQPQQPDSDALVHALQAVQTLPWMLRPVLVRRWVDAALDLSPGAALHPAAAQALRTAARLLGSPLPPLLARCFIECDDV